MMDWGRVRERLEMALFYVCLFLTATAALFLSQVSTLLIVAQLQNTDKPPCELISCQREEAVLSSEDSRPAWLWTLLLALTVPHMVTFLRCLILTYTRWNLLPGGIRLLKLNWNHKWTGLDKLFASLQPITGIIQTFGLCVLFFICSITTHG